MAIARTVNPITDSSKQWNDAIGSLHAAKSSLETTEPETTISDAINAARNLVGWQSTDGLSKYIELDLYTFNENYYMSIKCNAEYEVAMTLVNRGLFDAAMHHFQRALDANPGRLDVAKLAIHCAHESGDIEAFTKLVAAAVSQHKSELTIREQLIHSLIHQDQIDDALEVADGILRSSPHHSRALYWKAMAEFAKSDPDLAKCASFLDEASKSDPDDPAVAATLLLTAWGSGNMEKFHKSSDSVIEKINTFAIDKKYGSPILSMLAESLLERGEIDRLASVLDGLPPKALTNVSFPAESVDRLARCLQLINEGREAEWPKNSFQNNFVLATALASKGRHNDAARIFERLDHSPQALFMSGTFGMLPLRAMAKASFDTDESGSTNEERRRWLDMVYSGCDLTIGMMQATMTNKGVVPGGMVFFTLTGLRSDPCIGPVSDPERMAFLDKKERERWESLWKRADKLISEARRRFIAGQ